jgi:ABC-type transporter Mla MlaB component
VSALDLPHEPRTILLVISAPILRAHIKVWCECVRVLLKDSDAGFVICDVGALVAPDAVTVDALVRLQLTVRRSGRQLRLRHAGKELQNLLALMGLRDVVRVETPLRPRPRRQAEEREQGRGVEEERDPADPTS